MEAGMEHSVRANYEMHAVVKGQVQGVGFRAMTRYYATGLGLSGTVRNLVDGTVEIYAQGPKQRLEELMKKLEEDVFPGQIKEASIEFFPVAIEEEGFRIIR